ncbi:molybdenum cofactor guanylyltransferase MobA [Sulfurimonas marina]|uniref:Probable molybdenum cofactor guanylyltransferase n=1 Tax=Sulfurimonas marina TaxID=2590551 RepID=A0A7M1AXR0_9BACT|nr:molybdenum cofactor guanylyltransferase MobA [Sulfurimonas marina]QOP42233.1 molybdenum cofactor guanylyltransferase MobA [Sulfurimonas marina]
MFVIPCVIFAGGKSSRMGEDKALLPFGPSPTLTQYLYNKLSKLFCNVYISTKTKEKFNFDANFIEDQHQELFAPTTGFISSFSLLDAESFFAISVDTPFIDEIIIQTLLEHDQDTNDATIATLEGKMQPLCGIYHRSLLKAFIDMEKNNIHKLGYLLKNSNTKLVDFTDQNKFLNLNNKEEYQKGLEIINTSLI